MKRLLPDDVDLIVSINTKQLTKTLLFDAIYKSKWSENDLKLIHKNTKSQSMTSSGIQIDQQIVMFYDKIKDTPIQGFLFNISNDKEFKRLKIRKEKSIKKTNGKQGILLFIDNKASDEIMTKAEQFAEQVITKTTIEEEEEEQKTLTLKYKGNKNSYMNNLTLHAQMENESIFLSGSGKQNQALPFTVQTYNKLTASPTEQYLELQLSQLPNSIYQHFQPIFDELKLKIPKITSQQIMLYGFAIENINGATAFLPKFDGILRFDSIVEANNQINAIAASISNVEIINDKTFKVGSVQYYFQQISNHEIYIGVTESPKIKLQKTQLLPYLKGFPSAALAIEGKGFIAQLINVTPQVKNTRNFLKDITHFNIQTEIGEKQGDFKIMGEVRLKDGKMMSVELMKFLLLFAN